MTPKKVIETTTALAQGQGAQPVPATRREGESKEAARTQDRGSREGREGMEGRGEDGEKGLERFNRDKRTE